MAVLVATQRGWFDGRVAPQRERAAAGGRPIGSPVGQLAERDEETRPHPAAGFERMEEPLIVSLTRMQVRGELRPDASVRELADVVMAAVLGGVLMHVRHVPERLRPVLDRACAVLEGARA